MSGIAGFNFSLDDSILETARMAVKSSKHTGDFNLAFYRLMDMRTVVFFVSGPNSPLYLKLDSAIDLLINNEWPEL